ncbi:hypothetical protein L1887_14487 [Cichorium endivia]|nr:hypothetical protein L1887_14487 [Cichorium endivia]
MILCTKYDGIMRLKMGKLKTAQIDVEAHITRNTSRNLEIPSQVKVWLDEVEGINVNVENLPSDAIGCCSLTIRHKLRRKVFKIIKAIDSATRQLSSITWTGDPIPMERISSMNASTSATSSDHQDDFPSREQTFTQALKALEPNHKSLMITLCGMGGIGKMRMMRRLKKLNEKTKPTRADKIREWFKKNSDGGKTKFLIVLNDVWEMVDLNDIGFGISPNEGVDFKILLTS